MRVLFSTLPSQGHFYPLVPMAWALRAAGHDVLIAAPGDFAEPVTAAGLPLLSTVDSLELREKIGFDRDGNRVPYPSDETAVVERSGRGFARASAACLDALAERIAVECPDLVVCEPTEYAAMLVAEDAGVPWAVQGWGLPVPAAMVDGARDELAPELRRFGLTDLPTPGLVLDQCPPSLSESSPTAVPMRYVPYSAGGRVPPWLRERSGGARVCLTFGTMVGNYPGVVEPIAALARALAEAGHEVVPAIGAELTEQLPELPSNVRRAGWVPLPTLLPHCDMLVQHGGSGSTMNAFTAGVPQVVLPRATDQFANAAKVADSGAGINLAPDAQSPDDVLAAAERALTDESIAAAAARVAAEITACPSPADLVGTLEKHAAG